MSAPTPEGMKAGRELDALIAEKVMGLEYSEWKPYCAPAGWYDKNAPSCNEREGEGNAIDHPSYQSELPWYSTDMAAAWQVVEKLVGEGYEPHVEYHFLSKDWQLRLQRYKCTASIAATLVSEDCVYAATAPLAICLAALKAVQS